MTKKIKQKKITNILGGAIVGLIIMNFILIFVCIGIWAIILKNPFAEEYFIRFCLFLEFTAIVLGGVLGGLLK